MSITPKNWATFQHYKDRAPAWIKLHRGLLDDYAFNCLPLASRALAPMLWLLASEYEGGKITATPEELSFRLRVSLDELTGALKALIGGGFFVDDSNTLARRKRTAIPERENKKEEQVEKEGEKISPASAGASDWPNDFLDQFWRQYPRKQEKRATEKILDRLKRAGKLPWATLCAGVMRYAAACSGKDPQYIKQPPTWLNAGCWDDEIQPSNGNGHAKTNLGELALDLADQLRERERAAGIERSDVAF